jgi:hypothetical protein
MHGRDALGMMENQESGASNRKLQGGDTLPDAFTPIHFPGYACALFIPGHPSSLPLRSLSGDMLSLLGEAQGLEAGASQMFCDNVVVSFFSSTPQ